MGDIVGILVGSDTSSDTIKYAVGLNRESTLILSSDVNKARKFNTVEEARIFFTADTISFRKLENGHLREL